MFVIASLIHFIINMYILVVILEVSLSWLVALGIVNTANEAARNAKVQFQRLTEPAYKHLRKWIPLIGGIDLSPLILIIGAQILGNMLTSLLLVAL